MIKKAICFLLSISLILPLCGCWNNFDLNSLAVVVGVGFDKTSNGQMQVTAEILSPSQSGGQNSGSGGGGDSGRSSLVYTVKGTTFFDAIRNFIAKTGKRLYWDDVQVVVIGETYAKGGITNILDYFQRDQQANLRSDVIIAKGLTAKEVFEAEPDINKTDASQIDDAMVNIDSFGKDEKTTLADIVKQNIALDPCITVGVIGKDDPQNDSNSSSGSGSSDSSGGGSDSNSELQLANLAVQGSAILKNNKLVGYLTPSETRGLLFAENKVRGTIITVENPVEKNNPVALKLTSSNGKITTDIADEKPKLTIEVSAEGAIGDQEGGGDLTSLNNVGILTTEAEEEIKSEIESAASISQKEYRSDIFGFSEDVCENHYSDWVKMKPDWESTYSKSVINIEVDFLIDRAGMITKPLE